MFIRLMFCCLLSCSVCSFTCLLMSTCITVCKSVHLHACLSVYPYVCQPVHMPYCLPVKYKWYWFEWNTCLWPSVCLLGRCSACLFYSSACQFTCLSICQYVLPYSSHSVCKFFHSYACLSACLSMCLSVYLYVSLSVCQSICVSVYLYVCLSVCPYTIYCLPVK